RQAAHQPPRHSQPPERHKESSRYGRMLARRCEGCERFERNGILSWSFSAHRWRTNRSGTMKISARNQLKGAVLEVHKGQTTAHIRIELGNGAVITSSITNEAVD